MKFRIIIILVAGLLLVSCTNMALKMIGATKEHSWVNFYSNDDKSVAYIPMTHIGTKKFYESVRFKVDSLQRNGYIVFMESVRVKDSLTIQEKDTLRRKVRWLTGVDVNSKGYIDTVNSLFMGRKFNNKYQLINQPRYYRLGVDTLTGRVEDIPMNALVKEYEKKYGKIILTAYDFSTSYTDRYNGEKHPVWMNDFILTYRNSHLADAIANEPNKKIAVIYGELHEQGLYKELKKRDSTWIKNKNIRVE